MTLATPIPGTGVFSVDPAPKKPKRTRASASKVRTGCLTCSLKSGLTDVTRTIRSKARHVKCDEEKPFCKRCKKDKHKCDGYPERPQPNRRPSPNCLTPPQRRNITSATQLAPPIDWDVSGTTLERLMFHHVHRCTVPDFGLATPLAKIWDNYILPLAYYSDSVKHAVIALGVAHKAFLDNPSSDVKPSQSALAFSDLAERHYRKAVSETIQIMADPTPVNIRITLICCLVFVCFEIVRGQYHKAVQHLRSGSKVLVSLHQAVLAHKRDPASVPALDKCLVETVQKHFNQLCDITDMFTCMGMDASMLIEHVVVPDLSFFTQAEADDNRDQPFTSVSEARHCLHFVELMFADAFEDCWYCSSDGCWHSSSSCSNDMPSPESQISKQANWNEAKKHFEAWCVRFHLFQKALPENMDPAELDELKALRFSQKSWEIFNEQEGPCDMRNSDMERLQMLVDMAEDIVSSRKERPRPTFTLVADVVPSLAYICAFCDNVELERRIIDLLRSMKRREGLWDSQEMANLYETISHAKLDDQWKDEYNWETLPNLARMMSNLSLSGPRIEDLGSSPLALL